MTLQQLKADTAQKQGLIRRLLAENRPLQINLEVERAVWTPVERPIDPDTILAMIAIRKRMKQLARQRKR